jgi:alpha-D-ribose 1-methylphosphonate 5-triphosphate synthase subunit PhnH
MKFDFVQDTQRLFRKILTATSFPGRVVDLGPEATKIETGSEANASLIGCAIALLDAEATFCVWPRGAQEHERLISQLTYGRQAAPENAEFLFVFAGSNTVGDALRGACIGTLEEPHRGATLFIEVGALREGSARREGGALRIEGPGVKGSATISVEGLDADWREARAERCAEYPLGVDVYLVDGTGRLAGIPRTARLTTDS